MNAESDADLSPPTDEDPAGEENSQAEPSVIDSPVDVRCPRCDRRLPPDSPNQLCPYCLLASAACEPTTPWTGPRNLDHIDAPTQSELQPYFETLEVGPLIGRGGMGAVYRAHQHSLGRNVALKILLPEVAATEGFTDRFLREARALARLGHPNVVAVYDHGTAGPYAYLVIELVEGINLRELMAGQKLPPEEALRIVPQLCDALQFAHTKGVIHRDIKPENILIEESGRVKITDFGLAKLGESDEQLGRTRTRQVMGTVHYMAPEQIEHPRDVDHRADLYSLGVVFYELLTGELPLGRFSPPSEKAGTNRQVDHIVMKSLEKEPNRRYCSASEVRDDLGRSQSSTSVKEKSRYTARVVEDKFHQAAGAVAATAHKFGFSDHAATVTATALFYLLMAFGVILVFQSRWPLLPALYFILGTWLAAYAYKRLYESRPLPATLTRFGVPILVIARSPKWIFEKLLQGAHSIEGLRVPWMLAAIVAFLTSVFCFIGAMSVENDLFAGGIFAAPIAWFLMRMALPRGATPETLAAKVLVYPPVLLPLVPVTIVFLLWPAIAWLTMLIEGPPQWLGELAGLPLDRESTRDGAGLRLMIFGGLTTESGWLTMLALINAVFPEYTRWFARPILDRWSGRGRWMILLGCSVVLALSALLWTI